MPIDAIDAQVQGLVQDAQLAYQRSQMGGEADAAARREVEKKAAIKREVIKESIVSRETFQRSERVDQRMQQILGGQAGPEAQHALHDWQNNRALQEKLTEAQKNLFREAMASNPKKGAESANAMNRLANAPSFKQAVQTAPQAATIHAAVVDNPKSEKLISDVLQSRFMQSAKADQKAKNEFLRFAMARMGDGKTDSLKKAGDMLGTLANKGANGNAQRAAMNMATRRPGDTGAMTNVDAFIQQPHIAKLPSFARGKSTELLAKANGTNEVREGFDKLATHSRFKSQSAQNKGRFFATIGSGKPSEFRAITDKLLGTLQSPQFPAREGQVSKLLAKVASQVQRGGAGGIDPEAAVKQAKTSALPKAPRMQSTAGLEGDDANKVRSQNRAKIIQFYTHLSRVYEQAEKKLGSAKYFEDVNSLQTLRKPEDINLAGLSDDDRALIGAKNQEMNEKLDGLQKLQRQKARELRTKRMPAAKRRAIANERRAVGRKPKYFNPNSASPIGRQTATAAYLKAASGPQQSAEMQEKLASTPYRGQLSDRQIGGRVGSMDIQRHVATALQHVQPGGANAGDIAQSIADQVARQVAEQVSRQVAQQVTQQLMGSRGSRARRADVDATGGEHAAPAFEATQTDVSAQPRAQEGTQTRARPQSRQQGKVDGWGIPRTFERDLGGVDHSAVKAPGSEALPAEVSQSTGDIDGAPYTGKPLVKDGSSVRNMDTLLPLNWKAMSRTELALLKNLGWNQQSWDTKDTPAAKWPMVMVTPYVTLSPLQRESVRKLGMTARDWDKRVQAFTMGKNA